jgi:hypothetical protein
MINSMKQLKSIFKNKNISLTLKVRTFQAYAASVFLYNSELWTLTRTLENKIDAFQRRQLRYALGIFWPRVISNEQLYETTKVEPWSKVIRRRRINWLGHLLRLQPETPARKSLEEALRPTKLKKGRPSTTWLQVIKQDLARANITLDYQKSGTNHRDSTEMASNRSGWREMMRCVMLGDRRTTN